MTKRQEQALKNYSNGYSCSQSVICAYADLIGLSEEQAYKIFEGFGGGFGGLQEVCGAFTAICAIISYYYSDGSFQGNSKSKTYEKINESATKFKQEFPSINCKEILNGNKPVHGRCGRKILIACRVLEEIINIE